MDIARFDHLTRTVSTLLSRRTFASALGLGAFVLPGLADAKKKRKKNEQITRNTFGCVNVGGFCKNADHCCSGICSGKKGKRKCKAHDTGGCQAGQDICLDIRVPCVTGTGDDGECSRTTGQAGYCQASGQCFSCTKDADCQELCGPEGACIVCADCPETGGTACVGANEDSCDLIVVIP